LIENDPNNKFARTLTDAIPGRDRAIDRAQGFVRNTSLSESDQGLNRIAEADRRTRDFELVPDWAWSGLATVKSVVELIGVNAVRAAAAQYEQFGNREAAMYRHVLVPLDGSPRAAKAPSCAYRLARTMGARVTLVNVSLSYPIGVTGDGIIYQPLTRGEYAKLRKKQADHLLNAAARKCERLGLTPQTAHAIAPAPWQAMVATAKERKCDVIVTGSHGKGSVAAPWLDRRHYPTQEITMKREDSVLQRKVIDALDYEPSVDASQIGVAVKDDIVTLTGTVLSYPERNKAGRAARRGSGVKAVADELTMWDGGDLIVMGGYGHPRWRERVLGGATRALLSTMTVPVLMSH
jgi:nucleotide-binding universal stress UspA family protein